MDNSGSRRIVVGVSGASGAALGLAVLDGLRAAGVESHLVLTRGAELTIEQELSIGVDGFCSHVDVVYNNRNIGAAIASGTFKTAGMIVSPCSMKTLAGVASGYSENLLLRAADVTMKERRPLVLMVRETPFNSIHVDNMQRLVRIPGVVLLPPCSRSTTARRLWTRWCTMSRARHWTLSVLSPRVFSVGVNGGRYRYSLEEADVRRCRVSGRCHVSCRQPI